MIGSSDSFKVPDVFPGWVYRSRWTLPDADSPESEGPFLFVPVRCYYWDALITVVCRCLTFIYTVVLPLLCPPSSPLGSLWSDCSWAVFNRFGRPWPSLIIPSLSVLPWLDCCCLTHLHPSGFHCKTCPGVLLIFSGHSAFKCSLLPPYNIC